MELDKTSQIIDATKLQCFMDCPRKFFFNYVLGWVPDEPNQHLVFGSSWHKAMEVLILEGYNDSAISHAVDSFLEEYRQSFGAQTDDQYFPKSPQIVPNTLIEYCEHYQSDDFEPLYTEIAGTVPISDDAVLNFRMDSILRSKKTGLISSMEHKTGSQYSRQWIDQWQLKMQVGVYLHVLHCLFPAEQIDGVIINGVIFKKTKNDYVRIPIRKTKDMLQSWLTTADFWSNWARHETEDLKVEDPKASTLTVFPQNTESCTKYFGCSYHALCCSWANPLAKADIVPIGFKQEYWNPADYSREPAKFTFDVSSGIQPVSQTPIEEEEPNEFGPSA